MKKAIRILTTILMLSIATMLYSVLAAPLLEPESKYPKEELPRNIFNMPAQQIMAIFNPNDWEINSSRHLNYNNIHFFAGDYKFLTPDTIKFDKCTVVVIRNEKPLKVIIVQCLGEIKLHFERPITHGFDNNRLLDGSLSGKIRVTSKGDEENICFETQDFKIDKDLIWTKANVSFKYGRTQGIGSGMEIQFINHGLLASSQDSNDSSPISHKIASITIQKLQRLTIVPPAKKQNGRQAANSDLFNAPVELRCDGQFVFNALNKYASFKQNVSLIQTVSNKAPNSIRCQSLFLYFSAAAPNYSDQQADNSAKESDLESRFNEWDLQLKRLEAVGTPVVLEAPEYQTKIHASRFVANLSPMSFELDSANGQCEIYYKNNLISTQNMVYNFGNKGALGTLECNCSGWISSQMEQKGKQIRARWTDRLRLEPDYKDPTESIVSIEGSARLEIENNNKSEAAITANGIFFWLSQKNNDSQKNNASASNDFGELKLSRMQANQNVVMKSNPITAKVNTLQLWFEDLSGEKQRSMENDTLLNASSDNTQAANGFDASQLAANGSSYSVTGNLLQGKALLGQEQLQISELTLKDDVRIVQNNLSPNGGADNGKLEMRGSRIQVFNLTLPSVTASLIGEPAIIRYNNMMLSGSAINVNRGINKIWIESGGEAMFIPDSSEWQITNAKNLNPGKQLVSEPTQIKWSKSMIFQNDTLSFNGNVSLDTKKQYAHCDSLSIILNKKVDFQKLDSIEQQKSLEVSSVVLNNSVELKNQTIENDVTVAIDRLNTSRLTIDMKKQTFVAEGPGKAETQRKNNRAGQQLAPMLGIKQEASDNSNEESKQQTGEDLATTQTKDGAQLIHLSVEFQKRLEGSFDLRTLQTFTFYGYVKAFYSPIDKIDKEIDAFNISNLPPEAFTLRCNQMEIQTDVNKITKDDASEPGSENGSSAHRSDNSAFIASGGVNLEGAIYNAVADKITFEAKNGMITLEGDGQAPAQFYYQKVLGARRNQASSSVIHYNTQTGAVKGEGIQEFSLFFSPKSSQE